MSQTKLKPTSVFLEEHGLTKNTFYPMLAYFGYKPFGRQLTPGMENGYSKVMGYKIPFPDVDIIYPPKLEEAPPPDEKF